MGSASLSLMVFKGWFIGMQNTVFPMACDITVNVVNMLTSYILAVHTPMGAIGVAYGTLIAQYSGLILAVTLYFVRYRMKMYPIRTAPLFSVRQSLRGTGSTNSTPPSSSARYACSPYMSASPHSPRSMETDHLQSVPS